jgi:hypothetical protein
VPSHQICLCGIEFNAHETSHDTPLRHSTNTGLTETVLAESVSVLLRGCARTHGSCVASASRRCTRSPGEKLPRPNTAGAASPQLWSPGSTRPVTVRAGVTQLRTPDGLLGDWVVGPPSPEAAGQARSFPIVLSLSLRM